MDYWIQTHSMLRRMLTSRDAEESLYPNIVTLNSVCIVKRPHTTERCIKRQLVLLHSSNDIPEEFYGGSIKLTFFTLSIKPMFMDMLGVLFLGLGKRSVCHQDKQLQNGLDTLAKYRLSCVGKPQEHL